MAHCALAYCTRSPKWWCPVCNVFLCFEHNSQPLCSMCKCPLTDGIHPKPTKCSWCDMDDCRHMAKKPMQSMDQPSALDPVRHMSVLVVKSAPTFLDAATQTGPR